MTTFEYFDLPAVRLHAAVAGPPDGALVLLLHGFPECWYSWRHQIGPLAEAGYRVVAPDLRGFNLSDKRGPFDLRTTSRDIAQLVAACGAARAHLVGHDWGGVAAWVAAERYPEHVASLVAINAPHPNVAVRAILSGNLRQWRRSAYVYFFALPRLAAWILSRRDYALLRQAMRASSRPGTFADEDLEVYVRAWAQPGSLNASLGWYRAFLRTLTWRPWWYLYRPRVPVPGLILWGERDGALGVELAEASVRLLPGGRLVRLPDATHWIHEEFPEMVSRHLLEHLASAASA